MRKGVFIYFYHSKLIIKMSISILCLKVQVSRSSLHFTGVRHDFAWRQKTTQNARLLPSFSFNLRRNLTQDPESPQDHGISEIKVSRLVLSRVRQLVRLVGALEKLGKRATPNGHRWKMTKSTLLTIFTALLWLLPIPCTRAPGYC
jgi:hypothetical protein